MLQEYLESLQSFFGWCTVINSAFYLLWLVTIMGARQWLVSRHAKWFALDPKDVQLSLYRLLAMFKVMLLVFNFTPWLALLIMNSN